MSNATRGARRSLITGLPAMLALLVLAGTATAGDPYLGITMTQVTPSMARALKLEDGIGVLVDRVVIGSPAEQAGLQSGDVILAMDDHPITGNRVLSRLLRERRPGDELKLAIQREGKQRRIKVIVGERPRRKVDGRSGILDGIELWQWIEGEQNGLQASLKEHLTRLTRGYLGVGLDESPRPEGEKQGALISAVNADSPAEQAGLKPGDLIVAFNGAPVQDHAALQQHMDETKPGDTVELRIDREGDMREITIELAGMAERLGLSELIQRFQSRDPSAPSVKAPMIPPRPSPPLRPAPPRGLQGEQEDLKELRKDLEELKEQLRKLREELGQQR